MKRAKRVKRPYLRTRRSVMSSGRDAAPETSRLATAAGSADLSGRAAVEALEARQMLFSLTITPDLVDPVTGVGSTTATFGYVIPYIQQTEDIEIEPDETVPENFNDFINPVPINGVPLISPTQFMSGLILEHTIPGVNGARLVRENPNDESAGRLFMQMQEGQEFSFAFDAGSGIRRAVRFMQLDFAASGVGFDLNNLRVRMLFNGEEVASLTGLEIQNSFIGAPAPTTLEGTFNFAPLPPGTGGPAPLFDEIVFEAIEGTANPGIFIDDVSFGVPQDAFGQSIVNRIFGAQVTFTGPAGATAQVLDLYGRDMVETIALGIPPMAEIPIVDRDLDGVPDFNDGIGRIILSNTNFNSSLTIFGGTIMTDGTGFVFNLIDMYNGLFDEFQDAGFGYDFFVEDEDVTILGLPPGPGSVIIGSPYVRDNSTQASYNPAGSALASGGYDFNRGDQGVFVTGGSPMGVINIHGILHGSSVISGSVDRMAIGFLPGSITVDGDAGSLIVGGDAAVFENEENGFMFNAGTRVATDAQFIAQRTVGEIAIGGRSWLDITVVGDINTPGSTPRDPYRYFEKEVIYGIDPQAGEEVDVVSATLLRNAGHAADRLAAETGFPFLRSGSSSAFGLGQYRNDDLLASEWVGSISAGVQIHGELGAQDPVSAGEDLVDVYSFAVDGSQPIVVQITSLDLLQNVRLVDSNGRTVAGLDLSAELTDGFFTFATPDAGTYSLVIQSAGDGQEGGITPYVVTIGGIAPTTLGSYRVGGANLNNVVSVFAGSVGSVRVGTSYAGRGGALTSTAEVVNSGIGDDDDLHRFEGGSFSMPGSLYQILAGGDIEGGFTTTFDIGGDLGILITGLNPVAGLGSREGDVNALILNVGDTIGTLDIKGGIGVDQDGQNFPPPAVGGLISVNTGTSGDPGHIGMIRVGATVGGDTFTVTTSENSIIGAFLIEQDSGAVPGQPFTGIYTGQFGAIFTLGAGSDIRFVDINRIDLEAGVDISIPILGGQPVTLVDDAGGTVRIEVVGAPAGVEIGQIRVLPVDLSQGVAIGRIDVDLTGDLDLLISSLGAPGSEETISIGHINIIGSGDNSSININGDAEVDVWSITEGGGAGTGGGLFGIANTTPGGDIISIDVSGLTNLSITQGNLGSTEATDAQPNLAPFIGLIQLNAALIDDDWNNQLFRPITDSNFMVGNAYLDDLGSPFSPFLNGLRVRTGDIQSVTVSGSIGDVIAETGNIVFVQADSDQQTAFGGFDGIVGVIYSGGDIGEINVGDGLLQRADNPISTTGIFAADDIVLITTTKTNAIISSTITAGNANVNDRPGFGGTFLDGVETIDITGGVIFDAHISGTFLDDFWVTPNFNEEIIITGSIISIQAMDSDMRRTLVRGADIRNIEITNGVFDANQVNARDDAILIRADRFLNSTSTGTSREFERNEIVVGGNLNTLRTNTDEGDMSDLRVDILGQVNDRISARNFIRVDIDVDNAVTLITAGNDIRGSSITAGEVIDLDVTNNFRTSELFVSGPLRSLTADSIIDSAIAVTGPDGEIISIEVRDLLRGSVSASGPIGTIVSTEGDIVARITTTTEDGNVDRLDAARDLDITTDISGTVNELIAGRHIGNRDQKRIILVRGELDTVDVSGGQLYSDLRVGQGITGVVEIGKVSNLPSDQILGEGSIVSFGRINSVVVNGDFDGSVISFSGGIGSVVIEQGSFLAGNTISAFSGSIDSVTINSGHLLGDVHADFRLRLLLLNGDGVFGNIGVSPNLSAGVGTTDPTRNQLPPGVTTSTGIDGPRITAGENIGRIILTGGSIYEAFIYAGRSVGIVNVSGDIASDPNTNDPYATVIASGELVSVVQVGGSITNAAIVAGVLDFGQDNELGGAGAGADTVAVGRIRSISVVGDATNVTISSGIVAGEDGLYNTADDLHALGFSLIENVMIGGAVTATSAFTDAGQTFASAGVVLGGRNLPVFDGVLEPVLVGTDPGGNPILSDLGQVLTNGQAFNFTYAGGEGTILFNGPGTAIWNAAEGRLILVKSTGQSSLVVTSSDGELTDFIIQTNNNASLGMLDVQAQLFGNSRIVIDAFAPEVTIGGMHDNTTLMVGNNIRNLTIGVFTGGHIDAKYVENSVVSGDMGGSFELDGSRGITIGGDFTGKILMHRDLMGDVSVAGAVSRAVFSTAGSAGNFTAHSLSESRVSALTSLGNVDITGDVFDSSIMGGVALGAEVLTGGNGFATATLAAGSVGNVDIGGDFIESDITAGLIRGPDGFFGSSDDSAADGRANIGTVSIAGEAIGSNLGSESFRIAATGQVGGVTINGQPANPVGNFEINNLETQPLPIQVTDLRVIESSRIYSAQIRFNQSMDSSTIAQALRISEVRGQSGEITIRLISGVDYTLDYDAVTNTSIVTFSTEITRRDLPQVAGVPGPGVYRFELDADVLRSTVVGATLDGDGDGFGIAGDDYSQDNIVGDAGDKTAPSQTTVTDPATGNTRTINYYGPINLDVVLDDNLNPDGLADPNAPFTLRGSIGDHPDHSTTTFRFAGDVDVYRITLQAGQILRLGALEGSANQVAVQLVPADGGSFESLPGSQIIDFTSPNFFTTSGQNLLIEATGTYDLVVANADNVGGIGDPNGVPNTPPSAGGTGSYAFTIEVFDDGDSGFSATTDAGNGTPVVNAPPMQSFAGVDGVFGTVDDVSEVIRGQFVFTIDPGQDGNLGTADDIITGDNGNGIVSSRQGGVLTSTITSAIGNPLSTGVPVEVSPDVDIFHLNGREPIAPGTRLRITVKLAELGANLGGQVSLPGGFQGADFSGQVQLGVFETTDSNDIDDGVLVLSPSDFSPIGGEPGIIGDDGQTVYGYDDNGDFFVEFITRGSLRSADPNNPDPSSLAVYLQGVFNTDYEIEVVQNGTATFQRQSQNIFIETNGGVIDWLESGGLETQLDGFSTAVLGFTGRIGGMSVDAYVRTNLISNLQSLFDSAGYDVTFSSNSAQFEFEDFSTVFLTTTNDPIGFFTDRLYGVSEHADVLNADRNDEAAIFVPSMATLGYTPSENDINDFVDSLTGAVARRVGELMGLRLTVGDPGGNIDPQAANSVENIPTGGNVYQFSTVDRMLSTQFDSIPDTQFYLGVMNGQSLLDAILAN